MDLQNHKADFDTNGVKLFAISYDSVASLGIFSDGYDIDFPLLSDVDSKVIQDFGIRNKLIRPEETEYYGIPFPGAYLVDEAGKVIAKFFNQQHQVRESALSMLQMGFEVPVKPINPNCVEVSDAGVTVRASLVTRELYPWQWSLLYVDLQLDDGLHIYGDPIPDGYIKTEVVTTGTEGLLFGEPQFPPTKPFKIEGIQDDFHTFDGNVEIVVPVMSTINETNSAEIELTVSFQACTHEMCYLPRSERLHIELTTLPNVKRIDD